MPRAPTIAEFQRLLYQFEENGKSILTINGSIAASSFGFSDSIYFSMSAIHVAAKLASDALKALERYPAWSEEAAMTDYLGLNDVMVSLVLGLLRSERNGAFALVHLLYLLDTFTQITPAMAVCREAMKGYQRYLALPILPGLLFGRDTRTLGPADAK
jgi:hypothetical protein